MPHIRSFHFSGDLGATLVGAAGVNAGDFFSGHFAFDTHATPIATTPTSATYPLLSFAIGIPQLRFLPNGPTIEVSTDPMDPSLKIYGESPCRLHAGVLFRGPTGVLPNTALPTSISLGRFLIENMTISDLRAALFGSIQTGTPPDGATVFLRGRVAVVNVATGVPSV